MHHMIRLTMVLSVAWMMYRNEARHLPLECELISVKRCMLQARLQHACKISLRYQGPVGLSLPGRAAKARLHVYIQGPQAEDLTTGRQESRNHRKLAFVASSARTKDL